MSEYSLKLLSDLEILIPGRKKEKRWIKNMKYFEVQKCIKTINILEHSCSKMLSHGGFWTYWAIGCGHPLWIQSYTLNRAVGFLWGFHSSLDWFPWFPAQFEPLLYLNLEFKSTVPLFNIHISILVRTTLLHLPFSTYKKKWKFRFAAENETCPTSHVVTWQLLSTVFRYWAHLKHLLLLLLLF